MQASAHLDLERRPDAPQTLVVIDEHDIIPFSVQALLGPAADLHFMGSAADLSNGLQLIADAQPHLAIAEIGGTGRFGMQRVEALVEAQSPRPLLVLSAHDELDYGEHALRAGARGYVMKSNACTTVLPACRAVLAGQTWISPRLQAILVNRHLRRNAAGRTALNAPAALPERERQVLAFLGRGMSTKQIAAALGLGVRAVDVCRARLKARFQLRSGSELIAYASAHL